jgi:hypothetical protein
VQRHLARDLGQCLHQNCRRGVRQFCFASARQVVRIFSVPRGVQLGVPRPGYYDSALICNDLFVLAVEAVWRERVSAN